MLQILLIFRRLYLCTSAVINIELFYHIIG